MQSSSQHRGLEGSGGASEGSPHHRDALRRVSTPRKKWKLSWESDWPPWGSSQFVSKQKGNGLGKNPDSGVSITNY